MIWFGDIKFDTHQNHNNFFCRWTFLVCLWCCTSHCNKIAKKPVDGIDRGDSLVFQDFIQSWVGYELMKVLNVFGLQPKIRSDLATWSPDLFATFTYLSNRSNDRHKDKATKTLDLLFDQTEHNSCFGKLNFGSKEIFTTLNNSSLFLLILTWLRQLEQYC